MGKVNVAEKCDQFSEYWSPRIILIEPKTTVNTGDITTDRTVNNPAKI